MEKPTPTVLADKAGISVPYASQILSGARPPHRSLAIHVFRKTGWRPPVLDGMSDEDIATLERIEPWTPRKDASAAA